MALGRACVWCASRSLRCPSVALRLGHLLPLQGLALVAMEWAGLGEEAEREAPHAIARHTRRDGLKTRRRLHRLRRLSEAVKKKRGIHSQTARRGTPESGATPRRRRRTIVASRLVADRTARSGQQRVRVGCWNVRGFGGRFSRTDPWVKRECLFRIFETRKWNAVLLSDVAYPTAGVYEYRTARQVWTVVTQGRVAIALDAVWTRRWRDSGAVQYSAGGVRSGRSCRGISVFLGREGHRRGGI